MSEKPMTVTAGDWKGAYAMFGAGTTVLHTTVDTREMTAAGRGALIKALRTGVGPRGGQMGHLLTLLRHCKHKHGSLFRRLPLLQPPETFSDILYTPSCMDSADIGGIIAAFFMVHNKVLERSNIRTGDGEVRLRVTKADADPFTSLGQLIGQPPAPLTANKFMTQLMATAVQRHHEDIELAVRAVLEGVVIKGTRTYKG